MCSLQARWHAGDLTAFDEAIRACWILQGVPEEWLAQAAADLVVVAMTEEEKHARREWDRHCTRWGKLLDLREQHHKLSWERAREAVSEELEKTDAAGSAAAVKTSYELVEEAGGMDATFESYKEVLRRRRSKR
jgi:hypothetical protein